ncbi:hypothetical protein SAMN05216327_101210 [Dyadobacter sp. SG02]|uniref:hypothetical protein n=1 Tax=Dyadobacter sp. SG02 TaxID=1855291 RepID=UPI0008D615B0|nr:hypothetical protein [Dyadobacter sp. SG02]SEI39588.1 hypothetical protein SAMN05216327_101210 [Dyadobacter sp. SG02]
MEDVLSELCELPTGLYSLEFIPRHEISAWNGVYPVPIIRWYKIAMYRNSLTYSQPTEMTAQGSLTQVSVGCLVVNDSQELADQLQAMGEMRFVLRVSHYDGKSRIVGTPEEFVQLTATSFDPEHISGAQGYKLSFAGSFVTRPALING